MQPFIIKKKSELEAKSNEESTAKKKPTTTEAIAPTAKNKNETPVYNEYKSSSPSLKNISAKKVEEIQPELQEIKPIDEFQPKQIFSNDELKTAWLRYAEEIKLKLPRMFQVLHNHIPTKTSDNHIVVMLDSESQKKEFVEKIQLGLMGYLKNELSNVAIELTTEVVIEIESKNLIYTATDRFKYLAEQNPALETFKKKFNLDFD